MEAVHNNGADKEVSELFESLALLEKPSYVTKGVFQLEETVFLKHRRDIASIIVFKTVCFFDIWQYQNSCCAKKSGTGNAKIQGYDRVHF